LFIGWGEALNRIWRDIMNKHEANELQVQAASLIEQALVLAQRVNKETHLSSYDVAFGVARQLLGDGADEDKVANFAYYLDNLLITFSA
jgi:hypothetical protein